MSTSNELSRAVVECTRFLRQVYVQVSAMFETLDREMDRNGWAPGRSKDMGAALSNKVTAPSTWVPRLVSRVYSPKSGSRDTAIVVVVALDVDGIEKALVVTGVLKLKDPIGPDELFNNWKDSTALIGMFPVLIAQPETWVELPDDVREDEQLWSMPKSARIRGMDLAQVCGESELVRRVIQPAIAEARRLN